MAEPKTTLLAKPRTRTPLRRTNRHSWSAATNPNSSTPPASAQRAQGSSTYRPSALVAIWTATAAPMARSCPRGNTTEPASSSRACSASRSAAAVSSLSMVESMHRTFQIGKYRDRHNEPMPSLDSWTRGEHRSDRRRHPSDLPQGHRPGSRADPRAAGHHAGRGRLRRRGGRRRVHRRDAGAVRHPGNRHVAGVPGPVARARLHQRRVHQARDRPHRSGRRLAPLAGPRAARRARRTRRGSSRHVLHRRLRAGDDGRRRRCGPRSGPARGALRGRQAAGRRSRPLLRRPGRGRRARPRPAARSSGSATPRTRRSAPASRRCTACWATGSSPSTCPARAMPPSPSTAAKRPSTGS